MDDKYYLEFEKPIIELDKKIREIRDLAGSSGADLEEEVRNLEKKRNKLQDDLYSRLNRWQRVQLARHPMRPYSLDLVSLIFDDFIEQLAKPASHDISNIDRILKYVRELQGTDDLEDDFSMIEVDFQ